MVEAWAVKIVSSVCIVASLVILFFCLNVIFKYILQQDRSRHFINLFYLMAVLMCIANVTEAIYVIATLPDSDSLFEMDDEVA